MTFDSSELDAAAQQLSPDQLKLTQLMQRVTALGLRAGQKRTPVRTGTLRRSEFSRVEGSGERGVLGATASYARVVHERRPFFEQGLQDERAEIEKLLEEAGYAFLDRVRGS